MKVTKQMARKTLGTKELPNSKDVQFIIEENRLQINYVTIWGPPIWIH